MAIRAFAIVNDMGVMFRDRDRQLLIFVRRTDAERNLAALNIAEDGEFDGRVEPIFITPPKGRK